MRICCDLRGRDPDTQTMSSGGRWRRGRLLRKTKKTKKSGQLGFLVDGRDLHCIKVPNNNNHWYGLVVSAVLATEVQSAYCNRYWMNLRQGGVIWSDGVGEARVS